MRITWREDKRTWTKETSSFIKEKTIHIHKNHSGVALLNRKKYPFIWNTVLQRKHVRAKIPV